MDTGLIFPDFRTVRWKDGVQYVQLVIGFELAQSGGRVGKSARRYSELFRNPAIRQRELYKARFQENFLSLIS